MCGIAGFLGEFDPSLVAKMGEAIAHRGPDDHGELFDPKAQLGLAHRRLSIIDLSPRGHQPMWDATGQVCITYNGELFNFREIRTELVSQGFKFRSTSDTEVILNLYLREGPNLLPKLNGMFAFALWDTRSRKLLVARDGVGVKPIYYAKTPKGILFASEMKALLEEPSLDRTVDDRALQYYPLYLWSPGATTMFKSVRKLEPGCAMLLAKADIERQWRYYDLPYHQPVADVSEEEAVDQVYCAIDTAVARQMVADVPVGAFLSGGLDSSALVALARQKTDGRRMQCFTIKTNFSEAGGQGEVEDLPYAQKVAEHLDVDLNVIEVGPEMANQVERMIYHLDEPQPDLAALNVLFISELARAHGIKVLLSGAGGDDVFTGYRRHRALAQERYWSFLPQTVRHAATMLSRGLPARPPLLRRAGKALRYAHLPPDRRLVSYFWWLDPAVLSSVYSAGTRSRLADLDPAESMLKSLDRTPPGASPLNRMLYLEGKHFLADHNLNYTDKMSMAAGVETRVPLLDPDVVALAARLPPSLKQRNGVGKYIFKRAMEKSLPREVIYRPKTGFGVPLRQWLRGPLKELASDVLSADALKARGLFDPAGVQRLIAMDSGGRVDAAFSIFSLMCIELWCRRFLDSAQSRPDFRPDQTMAVGSPTAAARATSS